MAKLYDNLVVPEVLKYLDPAGFITAILRGMRLFTAQIASTIKLSLKTTPTRPYYRVVTVNANTIVHNTVTDKYDVDLSVQGLDIIGCTDVKRMALVGRDFTCNGTVYSFNRHPSYYGTVATEANTTRLVLYCVGGGYVDNLNPLGVPYHSDTNDAVMAAVDSCLYGDSPLGMSVVPIGAIAGCKASNSPLAVVWTEGDYYVGVTENNELVYAPINSGAYLTDRMVLPQLLAPASADYFIAKLPTGPVFIYGGDNNAADYPAVAKKYPEIISNGVFSGQDLWQKLSADGFTTYSWGQLRVGAQPTALEHYQVNPGKIVNMAARSTTADTASYTAPSATTYSVTANGAQAFSWV